MRKLETAATETEVSTLDPRERLDWFQVLPDAEQDDIREAWRADAARNLALAGGERRRVVNETLVLAAIFFVADILCPGRTWVTPVVAAALGAGLGASLSLLDAARLLSGLAGIVSFIALESLTRSGMSILHVLVFFNVGSLCAFTGYKREERGFE